MFNISGNSAKINTKLFRLQLEKNEEKGFYLCLKVLNVRHPVKKTSRTQTDWILKFAGCPLQDVMSGLALQLHKRSYFNQKKEDRVPSYSGLKREVKKKKKLQFALQSTLTHILMRNNYVIKAFTLQSSLHFNCNKDFFLNTGLLRHL